MDMGSNSTVCQGEYDMWDWSVWSFGEGWWETARVKPLPRTCVVWVIISRCFIRMYSATMLYTNV